METVTRMYELMDAHYENMDHRNFMEDLREKQWAALLADEEGVIQGFSTMMVLDIEVQDRKVKALFSGDTIIHRDYWGQLELPRIWGPFVISLSQSFEDVEFYWMLISKGYRTYRFLPSYFKTFYPNCREETPPFEKSLMDAFGRGKYPGRYDPLTGVIKMQRQRDYLKNEFADVARHLLKNPHVKFFLERNPGWQQGDELICAARLAPDNMKEIVHRYFLGDSP